MTRPSEIDDYDDITKRMAEKLEEQRVKIEYGSDSTLVPDKARPDKMLTGTIKGNCTRIS
ncbi:MAG: hypothetical protein LBD25_01615 [Coriobacteriales bacterium]|jgi:hypothetical protein|nr:hypothetical protein [Coriobacteriales bacterium]